MQQFAFNPAQYGIEPKYDGGGGGFPVGKHPVVITAAEFQAAKTGGGNMLVFTLTATDGVAKGQTMQDRLNVGNSNQQAQQIAYRQLAAYCYVVGMPGGFQALQELFNRPFVIEVAMQKSAEAQAKGYVEIIQIFDSQGNVAGKGAGSAGPIAPAGGPPQGFAGGAPQGPQGGFAGPTGGAPNGQPNGFGQPQAGPQGGFGQPQGGFAGPGQQQPPQGGFPQQQQPPGGAFPQQGGMMPGGPGASFGSMGGAPGAPGWQR